MAIGGVLASRAVWDTEQSACKGFETNDQLHIVVVHILIEGNCIVICHRQCLSFPKSSLLATLRFVPGR